MNQNLTAIGVVIDNSSSMGPTRSDTVGGFNTFLADQKALPGDATLTLAFFNHKYELIHDSVPLKDVADLTLDTYRTHGNTALLDAIGKTVNSMGAKLAAMAEADRPGKVILVILTDGEENTSQDFSLDQILTMLKHQQEVYSWEVVYLGANQNAAEIGKKMGIHAGNSVNYAATGVGTRSAYSVISQRVTHSRSMPSTPDSGSSQVP